METMAHFASIALTITFCQHSHSPLLKKMLKMKFILQRIVMMMFDEDDEEYNVSNASAWG